ncbi:FAR1-RELATED SEQUENCE 10 [Rhizophagus irregularis DAOM 181602=DAOM 197198]|uniref:FAR1 domain-containing protein n=2 Tax=Rhizophagus irregularis TaxID=588596 RepID=U9T953_RHIID|nr:FAR1-RELATED SEQUENCE 10 [Rhizophagus irregularis DAOM 181602=DAOM 197198]
MDVSELNVQKFTLIIPHKKEELGQVHQNDTNKDIEQVELSDTTEPQNLESKGKIISFFIVSCDDIDNVMKAFGKKNGFTIIKKRLGQHKDGNIKHRSFGCEFGGHYQSHKQVDINSHRNCKTKRLQCPWNANFNRTQNSQIIKLTTFNNSHNHTLFPADTEKYLPKYRYIPDDVLKEVQFLTEYGNLAITT